ncbi:thiolase domain-containing protein [Anaerosphaera multitolerans]|uniref:Thiolase domain-containing protein n=1 Tax=Anaerosphaera multitolerans TaxID=2487351 RepID=A0A437S9M7_9FIRM|nr:thiolase domain-containing protein [Anaerosphaera multitolerans]RVU55692.1 thiolase domain-containing protein [Anaerosphaera multitolerans]
MRSVSVIGIGETKMGKLDSGLHELILEAGNKAIEDAGIEKTAIEAGYIGNFDSAHLCNQNHIGAMVSEVLGLKNIPMIRTEAACASGGVALRQAYMAVAGGFYDIVLVGGVEKMTHQSTDIVTSALASAMDYEKEASLGLTFPGSFAMIAHRYFHEFRNVKKEMAMVAVQSHKNAMLNPDAQMPRDLDLETVLNADLVASPLSLYDCSLITDGAAFAVLATTEIAQSLNKHRTVEIIGSGHAGDTLSIFGKKQLTTLDATISASKQAYEQAGLKASDIDFAEVHDCFTITQIIISEDLGFFEKGKGADAVLEGKTARDGIIPINVSGGLKAKGHPIGATGISQLYEVVTQLRGDADKRQLPKANIGLTHNFGGTAGTCAVHILKGW